MDVRAFLSGNFEIAAWFVDSNLVSICLGLMCIMLIWDRAVQGGLVIIDSQKVILPFGSVGYAILNVAIVGGNKEGGDRTDIDV